MDAKAQYFYDLFFQMTGIERTDSEEAKQIIDLVKMLISNLKKVKDISNKHYQKNMKIFI